MISLGGGGKKSSTSAQHPRTQLNQNAYHHGHLNQNVTTTTYRWSRRREWTRCDRPCQGKKERRLVCYAVTTTADGATTLRQEVVHERQCPRHGRPPIEAKACNLDCELEWHVTEGGSGEVPQCSNSCGPGVRQQTVHCIKKLLGTNRARVVEMAQCEQYLGVAGRPSETVPCEGVQDCPALPPPPGPADTVTSYRWRFSEWTDCPAEDHGQQQCTRGNQTREAQCIVATRTADTGEVLAEEVVEVAECLQHLRAIEEGEEKGQPPLTFRLCPPCPPRWTVSEWSEVSAVCVVFYLSFFNFFSLYSSAPPLVATVRSVERWPACTATIPSMRCTACLLKPRSRSPKRRLSAISPTVHHHHHHHHLKKSSTRTTLSIHHRSGRKLRSMPRLRLHSQVGRLLR